MIVEPQQRPLPWAYKNTLRALTLFALSNPYLARRPLTPQPASWCHVAIPIHTLNPPTRLPEDPELKTPEGMSTILTPDREAELIAATVGPLEVEDSSAEDAGARALSRRIWRHVQEHADGKSEGTRGILARPLGVAPV